VVEDLGEVAAGEVRDSDRADEAVGSCLFHGVPGGEAVLRSGHGPVDEVRVDVVEPEPFEAPFEHGAGPFLVGVVELGGDGDLVACDAGFAHGASDAGLVAVAEAVSMCR
jgi:hypothetical protein